MTGLRVEVAAAGDLSAALAEELDAVTQREFGTDPMVYADPQWYVLGYAGPAPGRLLALDLETGAELWRQQDGLFGTWLCYSARHDVLAQCSSPFRDRAWDEGAAGITCYDGTSGAVLWSYGSRTTAATNPAAGPPRRRSLPSSRMSRD